MKILPHEKAPSFMVAQFSITSREAVDLAGAPDFRKIGRRVMMLVDLADNEVTDPTFELDTTPRGCFSLATELLPERLELLAYYESMNRIKGMLAKFDTWSMLLQHPGMNRLGIDPTQFLFQPTEVVGYSYFDKGNMNTGKAGVYNFDAELNEKELERVKQNLSHVLALTQRLEESDMALIVVESENEGITALGDGRTLIVSRSIFVDTDLADVANRKKLREVLLTAVGMPEMPMFKPLEVTEHSRGLAENWGRPIIENITLVSTDR